MIPCDPNFSLVAAVFLGLSNNSVLAQDDSVAPAATGSEQADANVTSLRRIEDGSVISNEHTIKWRILTDNARDFFLKASITLSLASSEPPLGLTIS